MVPAGHLGFCIDGTILWLGDANDHHHLIMRPDDIAVDALGLGVDWAATFIIHQVAVARVLWALTGDHIIVRRAALLGRLGWEAPPLPRSTILHSTEAYER